MRTVVPCPLPPSSVLLPVRAAGGYADCFTTDVPSSVTHAEFVEAFYTTWLFKLERMVIQLVTFRVTSDLDARDLAQGRRDDFAVWKVEHRLADQLLLADRTGTTKSWLMVEPQALLATRLYFGSAVLARTNRRTGEKRLGFLFHALLGFHRGYSSALLRAAASRLSRHGAMP